MARAGCNTSDDHASAGDKQVSLTGQHGADRSAAQGGETHREKVTEEPEPESGLPRLTPKLMLLSFDCMSPGRINGSTKPPLCLEAPSTQKGPAEPGVAVCAEGRLGRAVRVEKQHFSCSFETELGLATGLGTPPVDRFPATP